MKVISVIKKVYNLRLFKIIFLFFIFNCIFSFYFFKYFIPNIELVGDDIIKISVGNTYQELGYQAYTDYLDLSNKVVVTGEVNTKKIGKYMLNYKVNFFLFQKEKTRIVEVIDDVAPVIELIGDEKVTFCPNGNYQENGYKVYDNYDTNLIDNVEVYQDGDIIYYKVFDTSGNEAITKRYIDYEDTEKPNLKLNGSSKVYVYKNDKYVELGYSANDNCDGDITSKVKVVNNINTNKLGTYKVNYEVFDSNGNFTTLVREVQVIDRVANQNGTVYLTFDDGPSQTITASVLNILKEEGVQATFFVVNRSNNLNYLIKREYDEGHTVALHTYTHDYANIYTSMDSYFNDLEKIKTKVKNITGETSMIIRFPGGSSNTISKKYKKGIMTELTTEVVARGYHYFDWNVSSADAGGAQSSEQVYNAVTSRLSPNRANIVLMHDFENNYYTLNALRDIIKYGKDNGYEFKKITMDTGMVTHGVNN